MKVKEYIKPKQQYTPPSIYVKVLQMESLLVVLSNGTDNGEDPDPNDTEPPTETNPNDPYDPFNPNP